MTLDEMKREAAEILQDVKRGDRSRLARRFELLHEINRLDPKPTRDHRYFGTYIEACRYFGRKAEKASDSPGYGGLNYWR